MPIVLSSVLNDQRSGTNKVDVGKGTATQAGVFLAGFRMSWVDRDREFNVLVAATSDATPTQEGGTAYVSYDFRCDMSDGGGHTTSDNRLRSVVIAKVDSTSERAR